MNIISFVVSFLITAFGQPAWIRGCSVLAAAFGFALFWKAMLSFKSQKQRFWLSFIWFTAVQAVQLSWMTSSQYVGPMILIVYLFLIVAMGAQFGLLSFFFKGGSVCWRSIFAIASGWTLLEWARLYFLCGFSWNPVGLALSDSTYSLQLAAIGGIFGLSFWVILTNLAALNAMLEKTNRRIAIWACIAFFPYLFGVVHQWFFDDQKSVKHLEVALVQTGLLPEQKDLLDYAPEAYISPTAQWERILATLDPDRKLDLIVLPEAALPMGAHRAVYQLASAQKCFSEPYLPPLKAPFAMFDRGIWKVSNVFFAQAIANRTGADVIVGFDDADFTGKYNAAFHFYPGNKPYERYEKRVLVPLTEYMPFNEWEWLKRFAAEKFGIYGFFDHGADPKIFSAHVPIGVSICIEETFSGLTRELRLKGADLLVNLTNDVWFPGSNLPRQHFDHGRVRAAENGISIIRACNTGITGWVDSLGRSMAQLEPSEKGCSVLYASIPIRSHWTLYSLWGDSAILLISVSSLGVYFVRRKKKLP